jgi:hypothetical protein
MKTDHDIKADVEDELEWDGVANDIEVRLPNLDQRPDPDIARDAVDAIARVLPISSAAMVSHSCHCPWPKICHS